MKNVVKSSKHFLGYFNTLETLSDRYVSISDPSQRWKWENGTLKNKANLWQSNANWTFQDFNETLIRIENNTANKFLEANFHGQVVTKDLNDTELRQFWIQGKADTDGYTTLENSKSRNHLLTAVSKDSLEIKSK